MNIFVISDDVNECARWLDNVRLNKMIVESCQLLSTYYRYIGKGEDWMYKSTHENHPCAKWLREDERNVGWLIQLLCAYCCEYSRRKVKSHECEDIAIKFIWEYGGSQSLPTSFCNCSMYKDENDVFRAYRMTLAKKWVQDEENGRPPKWN